MRHTLGLDHAIILGRDLDHAEARLTTLGFRPTPRGYHSAAMGTANTTIMFGDETYFEIMGVVAETDQNVVIRERLAVREGLSGIAFKTDDARAAAQEYKEAGVADGDAVDFARPVALPDGEKEAAFSIARLSEDATPGCFSFVCQHHTPDVAWRPDYLDHPNGVIGVREVTGIADDLDQISAAYTKIFGSDRVSPSPDWVVIHADKAVITFLTPSAFAARFPGAPEKSPFPAPHLAALCFEVPDVEQVEAIMQAAEIPFLETDDGSLCVPPARAIGTLMLFREAI